MPGKSGDCMEGFSKNGELSSNIKNAPVFPEAFSIFHPYSVSIRITVAEYCGTV